MCQQFDKLNFILVLFCVGDMKIAESSNVSFCCSGSEELEQCDFHFTVSYFYVWKPSSSAPDEGFSL